MIFGHGIIYYYLIIHFWKVKMSVENKNGKRGCMGS